MNARRRVDGVDRTGPALLALVAIFPSIGAITGLIRATRAAFARPDQAALEGVRMLAANLQVPRLRIIET